jgi:hypothetical protein
MLMRKNFISIVLLLVCIILCFSGSSFGYVVYSQDFEATDGGYTHSGTGDVWQWGTPTAWPSSAASGSNCWGTNLAGEYLNNSNFSLVSGWVDLTAYPTGTTVTLKWKQALDIESSTWDNASCLGQTDASETQTIWEHIDSTTTYGWTEFSADISFAAGDQFRLIWNFSTDSSVIYDGLFIDDVVIEIDISPATNPDPEDHATETAYGDLVLSWACESEETFDLYLGATSDDLDLISEDIAVTSYDIPLLDQGTTYYWQVDVVSEDIAVSGDLWTFTTLLDKPVSPDPSNGADDAANTDVVLSWEHLSDKVSFDVYFGLTSDDMEAVVTGISEDSIALPDDLDFLSEYFWRVDVKTEDTAESGDLWSFTTAEEEKVTPPADDDDDVDVDDSDTPASSGDGNCNVGVFPTAFGLLLMPLFFLLRR